MKTKEIAEKYGLEQLKFDNFLVTENLKYKDGLFGREVKDDFVDDYVKKFNEYCKTKDEKQKEYREAEEERRKTAKEEAAKRQVVTNKIDAEIYGKPLYSLYGNRGRSIHVFEDFVIIKTIVTAGSVITGNANDGEKIIFLRDCIGMQMKEPGLTIGYIQLETASAQMNNLKSGWFNENTFTFDEYSADVKEVYKYLFNRLKDIKKI